jgi:O-antigen ligase
MSLTLGVWCCLLAFCVLKGLNRPAWMLCGYLQTVFAAPQFWWWGKASPTFALLGWSFWLGVLLLLSVVLQQSGASSRKFHRGEWLYIACMVLGCLNVAFVQFFLADFPTASYRYAELFWKTSLLLFLTMGAIRDIDDLKMVLVAIFLGCAFIGYEVIFAGQGYIQKGRLEGIAIPGASDSNLISGVLLVGLFIGGYLTLTVPNLWKKALTVFGSVLILETILRNNSRGTYLAMIVSGAVFLAYSSGTARRYATVGGGLGAIAVLLMAKNQRIWERFFSTFVEAEERDNSAQSRIEYWKAAIDMISSYPLGSGGEAAFMSPRGRGFISHLTSRPRAVHNGFLDIAASWGIQGFFLFSIMCIVSITMVVFTMRRAKSDPQTQLLFSLLFSIAIGQLTIAMFLSSLDCEIPLLTLTMCLLSMRVYKASDMKPESEHIEGEPQLYFMDDELSSEPVSLSQPVNVTQ